MRFLNQIVMSLSYRNTSIEHLSLDRSETKETCTFTLSVKTDEQYIDLLIKRIEKRIGVLKAMAKINRSERQLKRASNF